MKPAMGQTFPTKDSTAGLLPPRESSILGAHIECRVPASLDDGDCRVKIARKGRDPTGRWSPSACVWLMGAPELGR